MLMSETVESIWNIQESFLQILTPTEVGEFPQPRMTWKVVLMVANIMLILMSQLPAYR